MVCDIIINIKTKDRKMTEMAFDSENQPEERKPRGKGKKSLMLDAIRAQCKGGEEDFLKAVVKYALGDPIEEIQPNPVLMNMVLQRIEPPMKSTMPLIEFEFDKDAKPHVQASQVMKAASDGLIPPDIANMFVSSIASMMKIEEVTELTKRLEKLEQMIE